MRRIVHVHKSLLVIVLIVDQNRALAFKLERQPPVSADADRPVIFQYSSQRVQPPSRSVHVTGMFGIVESKQLQAQLVGMLHFLARSLREKWDDQTI